MNMFNVLTSASKVFAAFLGLVVMFLFFVIAIAVIFIVFTIVGNYKLFQKAGYNGWEAIVPFYNLWILVKIAGLKEYWFIGLVATYLANIIGRGGEFFTIAAIVAMFARAGVSYNLSKKFNKSETWFILSLFFSGITLPLLGYSNTDKYDKDKVVCENAFFNK